MTVTTSTQGYLEGPYLEGPYLTTLAQGAAGWQATFVIEDDRALGQQASFNIIDYPLPYAHQARLVIAAGPAAGMQASITVAGANKAEAMQALVEIVDFLEAAGQQASVQIAGYLAAKGFEVRLDKYPTGVCPGEGGYLEGGYLLEPYLTPLFCTRPGMQVNIIVGEESPYGLQSKTTIVDKLRAYGQQALLRIDALRPAGMQADVVRLTSYAMQSLATIYNTTNLRILCAFPSRGLTSSNWTSNSTLAGDFSVQNLDSDVVEQVWRSNNTLVGVRVTTDTGLPQGVFLDTAAILNHNLTKSATITMIGSNDPTFAVIGIAIPLETRLTNIFYIAPDLPAAGYRYWRFDIDDPTNPEAYLEIGTLLFGASEIFQGECFVDEIEFELKDFASTVRTEGFTNVANSRTQKRRLRLDFRSLVFQNRNFTVMREMFQRERTVQKCLWIPTPSATLQDVTARFAVFGKLSVIPTEKHNNKGPNFDYVTFTTDVDESL